MVQCHYSAEKKTSANQNVT